MATTTEDKKELDKETRDRVLFTTFIIAMFARAYKMDRQEAYFYLKRYGGLDYLFRHWWTLHAEDHYWAVKGLYASCYKNGGQK
jgi:hypothetical protein